MAPVADNCFCYCIHRCISGMENWNWTELALNDSNGVAPFGA